MDTRVKPAYDDPSGSLPYRRRVLDAAGAPQLVEAAGNAEFRAGADVALVDLAVIADVADDPRRPVFGQAEILAIGAFGADQPHHVGFFRFQRLVDIVRG